MLGQHGHQPSFRRNTSMVMIGGDVANVEEAALFPPPVIGYERPRFGARCSGDSQIQTAHFLKTCGLCHRSLAPDIDVYMYRGDVAFCSVECREQRMNQDERKERRAAKNTGSFHRREVVATATEASDNTENAVAA